MTLLLLWGCSSSNDDDTGSSSSSSTTVPTPGPPCSVDPCIVDAASVVLDGDLGLGSQLAVSSTGALYVTAPGYEGQEYQTEAVLHRVRLPDLQIVGGWPAEGGDHTGQSMDTADIDGDGIDELAVGRPGVNAFDHGGYVQILPETPQGTLDEDALLTIAGDEQAPNLGSVALGWGVSFADGGVELWVSGVRRTATLGRIHAFSTSLRGVVGEEAADRTLTSDLWLGEVAAWDGDGDGQDDLVTTSVLGVTRFRGPWPDGADESDYDTVWFDPCGLDCDFGLVLKTLGDLTGDGAADLAFSAPTHGEPAYRAGRAYVVDGIDDGGGSGLAADVARQVHGAEEGDGMGFALASGDVDGDGQDDLVVSASGVPATPRPGVVLVYRGPLAPGTRTEADADARVYGEYAYDLFARAIVAVEADGDGKTDLVLGVPGAESVYLVAGATLFP